MHYTHQEAYLDLAKKSLAFFSAVTQLYDAKYVVKVHNVASNQTTSVLSENLLVGSIRACTVWTLTGTCARLMSRSQMLTVGG